MIEFEFDENKSRANLGKHGVDFIDAQKLWDDPDLLEIPVKTEDEPYWRDCRKALVWRNHIPRNTH